MRGKKELVWAVVVSAAFITAGLILSCGDDDGNGEPDVTCEDICEKFNDCELLEGSVEDCMENCEDNFKDFGDIEGAMETFECTVGTRCEYIVLDCFCKAYCEKLVECEIDYEEEELIICVAESGMYYAETPLYVMYLTMCVLENSCEDIGVACFK